MAREEREKNEDVMEEADMVQTLVGLVSQGEEYGSTFKCDGKSWVSFAEHRGVIQNRGWGKKRKQNKIEDGRGHSDFCVPWQ